MLVNIRHLFGSTDRVSCSINGMNLQVPAEFLRMFGHCLVSDRPRPCYLIETAHFNWAVDHVPASGIAVDIGASGGIFTAGLSLKVGPHGKVFAFEPARRAHAFLRSMVGWNGLPNVTLEAKAISDGCGEAVFHELPSDDQCPWRPEASALQVHDAPDNTLRYDVPIVTIDYYFAHITEKIDLLKIDIEGFEGHALRGGIKTISGHKPFLCIDIHARIEGDGDTERDVRDILLPLGYSFQRAEHVLLCQPD